MLLVDIEIAHAKFSMHNMISVPYEKSVNTAEFIDLKYQICHRTRQVKTFQHLFVDLLDVRIRFTSLWRLEGFFLMAYLFCNVDSDTEQNFRL